MSSIIDINKIKPYLKKNKFYHFFIDYVTDHDSMKREISEIVATNRKTTMYKALNVRTFRVREVQKFIESNDLQELF
ncbi:hypothetical protein [uncultured Tenacibaculum sp.]|uniref:hypothetical protein n=1 Tax=uncultured Tenacibaculum sp. TaxID=174713 RepID=UPI00261E27E1|nr:hypothetical protein [uncultured Tenacibaculum sp.]